MRNQKIKTRKVSGGNIGIVISKNVSLFGFEVIQPPINITVSLLPNALALGCKTWLEDAIVVMHHLLLIGSKGSYTGALKFSSSESIWE
eukprot:scaffold8903_cov157-Skeletonema_dohrnii-CCMP3373.AAC.8